jgi:ketosteroid isomerase-like protein
MTADRFSWGPGEVKAVEPDASFHDTDFLTRLQAATNAHDVDAVVDCFTPDYDNVAPAHPGRAFTGRGQVRSNWEQIFAFVPDITVRVMAQAGDDREIWSEWEMTGTRRDGSPHHLCGVIVFSLRDGRACAARFFLEPVDEAPDRIDEVVAHQVHADR